MKRNKTKWKIGNILDRERKKGGNNADGNMWNRGGFYTCVEIEIVVILVRSSV